MIKKSLVILATVLVAIGTIVSISVTSAASPEVFIQELEILKQPNRDDRYTYVFNVCVDEAGDGMDSIRDPTILISSDKEDRRLQLTRVFLANECVGATERIRADDPNSIKATVVTFANQDKIKDIENRLKELQEQAEQENRKLQEVMSKKYPHHQDYIDAMNEQSDELYVVRKQLQAATEQYYQIMRYHHPESLEVDLENFKSVDCPGERRQVVLDQYGSPYCKAVP